MTRTIIDSGFGGALVEYFNIIKDIATNADYTDITTVEELRSDHPELGFMDDEEIQEMLDHAKRLRAEQNASRLALLDAGFAIQAQITRLERGKPIAIAKATSTMKQMQITKKYNADIKALREQLKAVNDAIWPKK